MARRSLSADHISVRALLDTSSADLLPSHHMESSTRQPADGAQAPPGTSSSSASTSSPSASSSSSSYTIYSIYSGPGATDQPQTSIRDRMLTVLHIKKIIRRLTLVVSVIFLLIGLTCLVTAGLTLVIPQHTDSAVTQQMVNTLFTMLNIAGVLCIVQGVAWSSQGKYNPRLDPDNVQQYPIWSRTPFGMRNRVPGNTQQGAGQTGTTSL